MQQEDYRRYDRIWQRVAPTLNPYPEVRQQQAVQTMQVTEETPCPVQTEAPSLGEMLSGFIEEELRDRRYYLCFSRRAPATARRALREMGLDEERHARRLMALYQMHTGGCYVPAVTSGGMTFPSYCQALQERYQEECGGAFHYTQAAEGTQDACLAAVFRELSADEMRHARTLLSLMEQNINPLA